MVGHGNVKRNYAKITKIIFPSEKAVFLPIPIFLYLNGYIWCIFWAMKASNKQTQLQTGLSNHTIIDAFACLREICGRYLQENPIQVSVWGGDCSLGQFGGEILHLVPISFSNWSLFSIFLNFIILIKLKTVEAELHINLSQVVATDIGFVSVPKTLVEHFLEVPILVQDLLYKWNFSKN